MLTFLFKCLCYFKQKKQKNMKKNFLTVVALFGCIANGMSQDNSLITHVSSFAFSYGIFSFALFGLTFLCVKFFYSNKKSAIENFGQYSYVFRQFISSLNKRLVFVFVSFGCIIAMVSFTLYRGIITGKLILFLTSLVVLGIAYVLGYLSSKKTA